VNRIFEILLSQFELLIFELKIGDSIVTDASILIILAFKHRAHACQLHDSERVLHFQEIVVHALLVAYEVPKYVI